MKYYQVVCTGDLKDRSLCLVEDGPVGMGFEQYRLVRGDRAAKFFPKDAEVHLRKERKSVKLAGILGNLKGYFIGNTQAKKIIAKYCEDQEIEYFPFILYNQKGKMHSTDYWFINPIGGFNCLDEKASGAKYDKDGEIITIDRLVLDAKKLKKAPNFFRVKKQDTEYVMSFTLANALKEAGVANVFGYEIEVK